MTQSTVNATYTLPFQVYVYCFYEIYICNILTSQHNWNKQFLAFFNRSRWVLTLVDVNVKVFIIIRGILPLETFLELIKSTIMIHVTVHRTCKKPRHRVSLHANWCGKSENKDWWTWTLWFEMLKYKKKMKRIFPTLIFSHFIYVYMTTAIWPGCLCTTFINFNLKQITAEMVNVSGHHLKPHILLLLLLLILLLLLFLCYFTDIVINADHMEIIWNNNYDLLLSLSLSSALGVMIITVVPIFHMNKTNENLTVIL